ncbi:MAG: M14 family zinc carboxypeptidase [Phycicoccus sp.]
MTPLRTVASGILTVTLLSTAAVAAVSAPAAAPRDDGVSVLRVTTTDPNAAAARLAAAGFDLVEARQGKDLLVVGDDDVRADLTRLGYPVRIDHRAPATERVQAAAAGRDSSTAAADPTFYGGYRTAGAYIQHLRDVASANPALAVTADIGDSWRKTQGLTTGNDLVAICITKLAPGDCDRTTTPTKPRLLVIGTVHARELTPTEVATRFVDHLTSAYGTDPEVTAVVDSTEVWVLPLANPDGRTIAELGTTSPYLQRKNANNTLGSCAVPPTSSNQHGVDLNRNFAWKWGGTGTSSNACDATYRGTAAASEPETTAISTFMNALYPDQRGPGASDAAPATTPGYMTTLHSYANMILIPWGDTTTRSPNDAGLRSMAFRAAASSGYQVGQPGEILYNVTGSTDDFLYGERGIAASTMEIGPSSGTCSGFVPAYSCQDSFWSTNRPALMYMAKAARAPYQLSLGPTTSAVTVSAASVPAGTAVTLDATGNDAAFSSSGVGRPAAQAVNAARYFVDTPPWAGGSAVAMSARDGRWNATSEGARATVPTTGLTAGRHQLYVQTRDSSGNWGPVTSVFLTVT